MRKRRSDPAVEHFDADDGIEAVATGNATGWPLPAQLDVIGPLLGAQ